MKFALILILLFPVIGLTQNKRIKYQLEFGNILSVYTGFKQIKPVIYNKGEKSFYLSSIYPKASASLIRFNEDTNQWENGNANFSLCVMDNLYPDEPIEVIAGESRELALNLESSVDDFKNPTAFKTIVYDKTKGFERPLKGKYKLLLQYAKEPFIMSKPPKKIYTIESQEFLIEP